MIPTLHCKDALSCKVAKDIASVQNTFMVASVCDEYKGKSTFTDDAKIGAMLRIHIWNKVVQYCMSRSLTFRICHLILN